MTHHQIEAIIRIALILFAGWLARRIIRRLVKRTVSGVQGSRAQKSLGFLRRRTPGLLLNTREGVSLRHVQRTETIGSLLRSAANVVIFVAVALAVIGQFSLNLGPFVAGTAVATAALGFGAQNIVRDFLAGFFIVIEDQYGVGDVIDLGDKTNGSVESVSLRITRLRGADGTLWHVPNGEIKKVGNKSQSWSRAVVEFRVTLNTDINKAIRLMKSVADDMWRDSAYAGVITDEPVIWAPDAIDADGILLKVAVKTRPLEQWNISRILRSRIKTAFDQERIRIATALPDAFANEV